MEILQNILKYIMFNYNNLKMNKIRIRIFIFGEHKLPNKPFYFTGIFTHLAKYF